MKKLLFGFVLLSLALFVSCGGETKTCVPGCTADQVCITEGAAPACKKKCEKNEDCATGEECHKDDGVPHCDKAD